MNKELQDKRKQVVASIVKKEDELRQLNDISGLLNHYIELPPEIVKFGELQVERLEEGIEMRKHHVDCIDALETLAQLADIEARADAQQDLQDEDFEAMLVNSFKDDRFSILEPNIPKSEAVSFGDRIHQIAEEEGLTEIFNWDKPLSNGKPNEDLTFKWDDNYEPEEQDDTIFVAAGNVTSFMGGTMITFADIPDGTNTTKPITEVLTDRLAEVMPGNTIEIQIVIK